VDRQCTGEGDLGEKIRTGGVHAEGGVADQWAIRALGPTDSGRQREG
jgi:hypothetical protein